MLCSLCVVCCLLFDVCRLLIVACFFVLRFVVVCCLFVAGSLVGVFWFGG